MLPMAVLPIAGMLLRLGRPDFSDVAFVAAGDAESSRTWGCCSALASRLVLRGKTMARPGRCVLTEGAKVPVSQPSVTAGFAEPGRPPLATAAWKAKQLDKLSVPAGVPVRDYRRGHALR